MSFQISDIVLFAHSGERRILTLKTGAVNIITGDPGAGKTALIEIIDYCLGAKECGVPAGVIRQTIAWFGLRLALVGGTSFVARRCPTDEARSSEECFVDTTGTIPANTAALRQTTNIAGLRASVSQWTGIRDTSFDSAVGQEQPPVGANIRHALWLTLQPQNEICQKKFLFHDASDNWVARDLRELFPYFLGAVDDDYLKKRDQVRRLRDRLKVTDRRLAESQAIRGTGLSQATSLLAEARDLGLSDMVAPATWTIAADELRQVVGSKLALGGTSGKDGLELERLAQERRRLVEKRQLLRDEIMAAQSFSEDETGFVGEVTEQVSRLSSVNIFRGKAQVRECPVCSQVFPANTLPSSLVDLTSSLEKLSGQLELLENARPDVRRAVDKLERELQDIQVELLKNRQQAEKVRSASDELSVLTDEAARKARCVGRISLFLENAPTVPDIAALEADAASLRSEIKALDDALDEELLDERLQSILSLLNQDLTLWGKRLGLEHSDSVLRLDIKKLLPVADTINGSIPMNRMGSGKNWVGYHLVSHLALHRQLVLRSRPVPRFLFLDQPSQAFFPAEQSANSSLSDLKDADREAVAKMFELIFEVVELLAPKFQVIVTEHAEIPSDAKYEAAVVERWRGSVKLVPANWIEKGKTDAKVPPPAIPPTEVPLDSDDSIPAAGGDIQEVPAATIPAELPEASDGSSRATGDDVEGAPPATPPAESREASNGSSPATNDNVEGAQEAPESARDEPSSGPLPGGHPNDDETDG